MGGGCSKYAVPMSVEVVDVRNNDGMTYARVRGADGRVHELAKTIVGSPKPGQQVVVFATEDDGVPFSSWAWRAPSGRLRVDTGDCRSLTTALRLGQVVAAVGAIVLLVAMYRKKVGVCAGVGIAALGCVGVCVLACVVRALLARFVFDEAVSSDLLSSDPSFKG